VLKYLPAMNSPVEIAPSILAADFSRLGDEIQAVERGGAGILHVDVMDGHFVPNITIGVPVVASLRKATSLLLDVHLMIEAPDRYVEAFAEAGADMISVHQEAAPHLHRVLASIREMDVEAGVVINPATPVSTLTEVLPLVDYVLVMSVNPGFGGQKFIPGAYDKIRQLKALRSSQGYGYRIEVDGGVDAGNAAELVRAGAEILVAGTAVFHTGDAAEAVRQLRHLTAEALVQKV
jgi:ribulose-phosphate 3-epimerase